MDYQLDLTAAGNATEPIDCSRMTRLRAALRQLSDPTPGTFAARLEFSINDGASWHDSGVAINQADVSDGVAITAQTDCTTWTRARLFVTTALAGLTAVADLYGNDLAR